MCSKTVAVVKGQILEKVAAVARYYYNKDYSLSEKMLPVMRIVITGGVTTANVPYHVAVLKAIGEGINLLICSGSIVSPRFVLTAAECFHQNPGFPIKIRAGSPNGGSGGSLHKAKNVIRHNSYRRLAGNNFATVHDIALIEVNEPFKLGPNIAIVPLFEGATPSYIYGTASTWGTSEEGLPVPLKAVSVELWDKEECQRYYGNVPFPEGQICTGNPRQKSCRGNLGGPLVVDGVQVGIDIWGESVCWQGPLVYTEVAHYIPWINDIIYELLEIQD